MCMPRRAEKFSLTASLQPPYPRLSRLQPDHPEGDPGPAGAGPACTGGYLTVKNNPRPASSGEWRGWVADSLSTASSWIMRDDHGTEVATYG